MKKHLKLSAIGTAAAAPVPALASGFYLPWWGEALAFLALTPAGWLCAVSVVATVLGVAWRLMRRGSHD